MSCVEGRERRINAWIEEKALLGATAPLQWFHWDVIPFQPARAELSRFSCKIALLGSETADSLRTIHNQALRRQIAMSALVHLTLAPFFLLGLASAMFSDFAT